LIQNLACTPRAGFGKIADSGLFDSLSGDVVPRAPHESGSASFERRLGASFRRRAMPRRWLRMVTCQLALRRPDRFCHLCRCAGNKTLRLTSFRCSLLPTSSISSAKCSISVDRTAVHVTGSPALRPRRPRRLRNVWRSSELYPRQRTSSLTCRLTIGPMVGKKQLVAQARFEGAGGAKRRDGSL
jgi:hypothetical protein